jgi:FkbM family methyltransferase
MSFSVLTKQRCARWPNRAEGSVRKGVVVLVRLLATDAAWGSFTPKGISKLLLDTTQRLPRNWAGKRLFYALRKAARAQFSEGLVDVVRFGARMRLNAAANNVCEGRILFNPDYFDLGERAFLQEHLPERPVFIDAGANIGGYSFFVCHARPQAQVIAIEAQNSTYDRLAFNAALNPWMNIYAVNCALSDKNATAAFFINDKNHGESSIRPQGASGRGVQVSTATLLKVAENFSLPRIDALKLDIEGAEDLVLKSFFETAPERLFPKLILIEHAPPRWDFDVFALLEAHGYRKLREFGGNVALKRD